MLSLNICAAKINGGRYPFDSLLHFKLMVHIDVATHKHPIFNKWECKKVKSIKFYLHSPKSHDID